MVEKLERVDKLEEHIKIRFFLQKKWARAYGVVFKATDVRKSKNFRRNS